jgi:hypothetical protein
MGGDLTKLDAWTTSLLTNPEVIAVNQASTNNRQLSRKDDLIVWVADAPNSRDRYVLLLNARSDGPKKVEVALADLGITDNAKVRDLWKRQDLGRGRESVGETLAPHASSLYRITPTLP